MRHKPTEHFNGCVSTYGMTTSAHGRNMSNMRHLSKNNSWKNYPPAAYQYPAFATGLTIRGSFLHLTKAISMKHSTTELWQEPSNMTYGCGSKNRNTQKQTERKDPPHPPGFKH